MYGELRRHLRIQHGMRQIYPEDYPNLETVEGAIYRPHVDHRRRYTPHQQSNDVIGIVQAVANSVQTGM